MSLSDQVQDILQTETDRKNADSEFAKAIKAIDRLKAEGVLGRTKYTLPPTDTIGIQLQRELRHTSFEEETEPSHRN